MFSSPPLLVLEGLMTSIYVPGKGNMDTRILRVDRALHQYDERLYLKFNEVSQEWCVFVKVPRGSGDDVPVLGLGTEVPHRDYVLEKIRSMDTKTHASNMLELIRRNNDKVREDGQKKFLDGAYETADIIHTLTKGTQTKTYERKPKEG